MKPINSKLRGSRAQPPCRLCRVQRRDTSPLPEPSCLNVAVIYQDLPAYLALMITTMAISHDLPLVNSLFGPVQEGSVLSYQMPTKAVPRTCPHSDAPSPPQLPLSDYRLGPSTCSFIYTVHYNNTITWHPLNLWRQPTKFKKLWKKMCEFMCRVIT